MAQLLRRIERGYLCLCYQVGYPVGRLYALRSWSSFPGKLHCVHHPIYLMYSYSTGTALLGVTSCL